MHDLKIRWKPDSNRSLQTILVHIVFHIVHICGDVISINAGHIAQESGSNHSIVIRIRKLACIRKNVNELESMSIS